MELVEIAMYVMQSSRYWGRLRALETTDVILYQSEYGVANFTFVLPLCMLYLFVDALWWHVIVK